MPKSNLEKLQDVVKKLGPDYSVYPNYSGRFMFGETCLGVVGPDVFEIKSATRKKGFSNPVVDNMGLDFIVYWPRMK